MKIFMYTDRFGISTQTFITQDVNYLSKNHEILFICTIVKKEFTIPNVTVKHISMPKSFILVEEKDINTYAQRMQDILSWEKLPKNREWLSKEFEINYHIEKLEDFYVETK